MTMCQIIPARFYIINQFKTNQKDSTTVSLGVSATWSKPLDKELQQQCKDAAAANIALMEQAVANKRLDFEIARLKNCGELMKMVLCSIQIHHIICCMF